MPFLLYVSLNMAIQAALELCFFEFFTAPEHAVWELAVVNGIEIPIFYRMYRESRIREQLDETESKRGGKNAVWKRKSRAGRLLLAILGGLFLGRGFNLLIGLNGYTVCSGVIDKKLNGKDIIAVPLADESDMRIGYITHRKGMLSRLGTTYLEALQKYLG